MRRVRTQAEIDEDRRTMSQAIVDGQRLENLDDAKRFAKAWIETAAQHAANETYYHDERDKLLRLLIEVRPFVKALAAPDNLLLARANDRVREADRLLDPKRSGGGLGQEDHT